MTGAANRRPRAAQAAAVTSRHVCMADARKGSVRVGGGEMALDVERVVGGRVEGQESLG
jgi:hypothetical protein